MHLTAIAQCLALIATANIIPPAAKLLLAARFSLPVDAGGVCFDGRPLLGPSKTLRGVLFAVPGSALVSYLMGLGAVLGATVGIWAMAGDMASSFCKRRMGLKSSAPVAGLDQIPESLLPAIACAGPLNLSWYDVVTVVVLFTLGDAIMSPDYRRWRFPWERRAGSAG